MIRSLKANPNPVMSICLSWSPPPSKSSFGSCEKGAFLSFKSIHVTVLSVTEFNFSKFNLRYMWQVTFIVQDTIWIQIYHLVDCVPEEAAVAALKRCQTSPVDSIMRAPSSSNSEP